MSCIYVPVTCGSGPAVPPAAKDFFWVQALHAFITTMAYCEVPAAYEFPAIRRTPLMACMSQSRALGQQGMQ
jgi:hypothetical protein